MVPRICAAHPWYQTLSDLRWFSTVPPLC